MIEQLFRILLCHLTGDYCLQSEYMVTKKAEAGKAGRNRGEGVWMLLVHSLIYTLPFVVLTQGAILKAHIALAVIHFLVDFSKIKHKIGLVQDQFFHLTAAFSLFYIS